MPRLASLPVDALADTLATNVLAPLALIQAVLPGLRERRGAILNITSDAAVENYETWGGYGTSRRRWSSCRTSWPPRSPASPCGGRTRAR